MFGPGIAISAIAASANRASVDGAGMTCASVADPSAASATLDAVIAQVEPLTTTRRLSGPFDYRVDGDVVVGSLVRIPFGHQKLDGVVVGLSDVSELPDERLVSPTSVRDDTLPPDLVELATWMAEEYCSTPARALAL